MTQYSSLFAVAALCAAPHLMAQAPQMHPNYPTVRKEWAEAVLAMRAGVETRSATVPWRLYVPEGASAAHKLPLVVVLHGAGSRGDDNVRPMALFRSFWTPEMQKKHPCFILAPQMKMGWVLNKGGFINYNADSTPISKEMETMLELVKRTIAENPVDAKRVYLIGTSMGGFGVWDALYRVPGVWAAAVPICGGGDPTKAAVFQHVPIWAWHGANDRTVTVENTRAMVEALKKAGANPRYNEPPVDHNSWINAFGDPELYEWMFSQSKSRE